MVALAPEVAHQPQHRAVPAARVGVETAVQDVGQLSGQGVLELGDRAGQRGLGDVQPVGGQPEVQGLGDGDADRGLPVGGAGKGPGGGQQLFVQLGAALPVTALVDQFYKDVQAMGGGRWDTSSLIARLRR